MGIQPATCLLPCHRRQPDRFVCFATTRGSIDGTAQGDDFVAPNCERVVHDFGPVSAALGSTSAVGQEPLTPTSFALTAYRCGGAHSRVKGPLEASQGDLGRLWQFALSSWPRSASWDAYRVNGEIPRQDSSQGRSGPARSAGSSLARNQKAHGPGKPAERPVNRSGDGPRPADRSQGTAVQAVLALRSVRLWQLLPHRPYPPDRRRGRPLCGCDEADRRRRGIWP